MSVQYRVIVGKKDERVDGPDDAAVVITAPIAVASSPDFDANIEFMRGTVKATGNTGVVFDALRSGDATQALHGLATRP